MTELTELELLEVSLVDAGDDPLAKVAIFKQKEETEVTDEELEKAKRPKHPDMENTEEQAVEGEDSEMMEEEDKACKPKKKSYKAEAEALAEANNALVEEVDTLKAKVEVLEKALEDKEVLEKGKQEENIEIDGEQIAKSAIPAPVLKKLEELNKAREKEALEKRAEELLSNTVGTVEKKAKLVKAFGDDEEMLEMLRAIDAAFASHFEEVGKGKAVEFESPQDELDSMIKAYMDEHNVEKAKATVEVTKSGAGRELLLKTQKKETK